MKPTLHRFAVGSGLLAFAVLAGGATGGKALEDISAPTKAVIYFYRSGALYGRFISARVQIGAVSVGKLKSKQYIVAVVEPGKHRLRASAYAGDLEVTVGPGSKTYVKVEMFEAGATTAEARLVLTLQAEAAKKIKRFKFKGGVRILENGMPAPL